MSTNYFQNECEYIIWTFHLPIYQIFYTDEKTYI